MVKLKKRFLKKHGDQSWFMSISKALINIQDWFGQIPNVHIHGNCAKVNFVIIFYVQI